MKVLIIENEIYLAQSIATKLSEFGFDCNIVTLVDEALENKEYDVVLLSTNLIEQSVYPIIEAYKDRVIVLMTSYVSDDTVTKPMQAGAKDYILKPFMIDELIRKIEHYYQFQHLKQITHFYDNYVDFVLQDFKANTSLKADLPLVIKGQSQRSIDAYVISYMKQNNFSLSFFSLKNCANWRELLSKENQKSQHATYIVGLEEFKRPERKEFFDTLLSKQMIISYIGTDELEFSNTIQLDGVGNVDLGSEILCIDDYIKNIILQYEHKYPDTELSRRLGMSRKSLWEKRKKYGIIKKK